MTAERTGGGDDGISGRLCRPDVSQVDATDAGCGAEALVLVLVPRAGVDDHVSGRPGDDSLVGARELLLSTMVLGSTRVVVASLRLPLPSISSLVSALLT